MTVASKIVKLRKAKGMTQSDLGQELNVTYQAVSKWERGESQPDFDTMCKLARLFGVPITYFEDDGLDGESNNSDDATKSTVENENAAVDGISQDVVGMCVVCGRMLREGEQDQSFNKVTCLSCGEKARAEAAQSAAAAKQKKLAEQAETDSKFKKRTVWAIVVGSIVSVTALAILIWATVGVADDELLLPIMIAECVFGPILLFSWVFQLFFDGVTRTVTCWGLQVIKLPGIIFSADLSGLIFLAVMKIFLTILAWLISFALIIATSVLGMIVSIFTFIPLVVKIHKRDDDIL